MTAFRTPTDIANRALQHCGANRLDPILGFNDGSANASEVAFTYDKLREAELMQRYWTFAIKRTILRALDVNTMRLAAALWSPVTTYFVGSIVADADNTLWISNIPDNLNNDPLLTLVWEPYCGPMSVSLYTSTVAYGAGELVYTAAGDGTNRVYLSLQSSNSDNPATATAYDATVTYQKNQVVTSVAIAYMSLVDLNKNNTPASSPTKWTTTFVGGSGSLKWLEIGGAEFPSGVTLSTINLIYPWGAGPLPDTNSKNVFLLPAGYLRRAPQNPKPGLSPVGGPSGVVYDDWLIEGGFLTSRETGPLLLRFVANITDVRRMHALFCEGLAARIALAICDRVTQDKGQTQLVARIFKQWEDEALTIDGIEDGYVDPPDDDFVTVRY